ncbi:MAG: diguanylate cyclase [Chroococcales cyanobacterium]
MNQGFIYEEKYSLFDRIPVGVCVLRSNFNVLFWNNSLENWTKIPRSQIFDKDIRHFFPNLKEPKYSDRLLQIFEGGPPTVFSSQLHKNVIPAKLSNGQECIQHTTVTAVKSLLGEGFDALLVIQDVTDLTQRIQDYRLLRNQALEEIQERKRIEEELRQSEERYAKIFEEGPLGMAIFDFDYSLIQVNAKLCEMLGYLESELTSLTLLDITAPQDIELSRKSLNKLSINSQGSYKIEQRFLCKNQESLWITLTASVIHDQAGNPLYGLALIEDITQRKRSEQDLQEANQKLTRWVNELELRNHEITLLSRMSDVLQACLSIEEAYQVIPQLVQSIFPTLSGAVFILPPESSCVKAVASWGYFLGSKLKFSPHECWALRRGKLHSVQHQKSDLRCAHIYEDPVLVASLCVPMMSQGKSLGLLYLASTATKKIPDSTQKLAVTVAEHIALALANLQLRETLQQQSIRDPLTGLFNRRYMEEFLAKEIHRAKRKQRSLGVIMLDVDYFKQVNDTLGHEAGDVVLRELGQYLLQNIRRSDVACRYGGEELTLILPEASLVTTYERAEELRQGIKSLKISANCHCIHSITVSLGIACFPQHGITGDAIVKAADIALYRAKAQGRDRVVRAD